MSMGISWEDIQAGVLDTGKIVGETMALWNQVTGKESTTTPSTAATTTAGGSTGTTTQAQTQTTSESKTVTSIPAWAMVALGLGGVVLLVRILR